MEADLGKGQPSMTPWQTGPEESESAPTEDGGRVPSEVQGCRAPRGQREPENPVHQALLSAQVRTASGMALNKTIATVEPEPRTTPDTTELELCM